MNTIKISTDEHVVSCTASNCELKDEKKTWDQHTLRGVAFTSLGMKHCAAIVILQSLQKSANKIKKLVKTVAIQTFGF